MRRTTTWIIASFVFPLVAGWSLAEPSLKVIPSTKSGQAGFITMSDGSSLALSANTADLPVPAQALREYGHHFGVGDVDRQLVQSGVEVDLLGHIHTRFQQVHRGVRVFGGGLTLHHNDRSELYALHGHFFQVPDKLTPSPGFARDRLDRHIKDLMKSEEVSLTHVELVVVDPGWYGDRPQGPRLAYYVKAVSAADAQAFFIDAQSGKPLDQWSLMETARSRRIYNANFLPGIPGQLARVEGQSPVADFEVNRAYDYTGDTYDYFWRGFGRDSFNNQGGAMIATVNSTAVPCPNAFWNGIQAAFCPGLTLDDVVGHEFTHGLIQHTADLIYQNQPGQLNESYADVFGELIDLFNGNVGLPGPPSPPDWPAHPTGPGADLSNELRQTCVGGVRLDVIAPESMVDSYAAGMALFGPPLDQTGVTGELAVADPPLACDEVISDVAGKIAIVDRGMCNFDLKVVNAQLAGAIGVVVANNREGPLPFLSGTGAGVTIPSVGITQAEGAALRAAMETDPVVVTMVANDSSAVRWLMAEDGLGNQFRDMWMPSCLGDPDSANHPFQTCNPFDNGGVHSGSGVPNHAFALVTDGGSFRGFTVQPIGPVKAGAVWYRALTTYLTEVSDFQDAFTALNQSAKDLVGTFPLDPRTGFPFASMFTSDDAQQVNLAMQAVEMDTPGLCGSFEDVLDPEPFSVCDTPVNMYSDDFEGDVFDWDVHNSGPPTSYNWVLRSGLPMGMPGTAWYVDDPPIGDCQGTGEAGLHSLASPILFVWDEAQNFYLSFTHLVATEPAFDGGNIKISVNKGPFELIPQENFAYNPYNASIPMDSLNPLAGQPAFTGRGAVWGLTVVDLTNLANGGDLVQFQFDFGKDQCGGHDGWYIGDISLFLCIPEGNGDFNFDNKVTLEDVAYLQRCMNESVRSGGPCVPGDFDQNGVVNLRDVKPMVELLDDP